MAQFRSQLPGSCWSSIHVFLTWLRLRKCRSSWTNQTNRAKLQRQLVGQHILVRRMPVVVVELGGIWLGTAAGVVAGWQCWWLEQELVVELGVLVVAAAVVEHSNLLGMDQPSDELDVSGCSSRGTGTFSAGRAGHGGPEGNAPAVAAAVAVVGPAVAVVGLVHSEVGSGTVRIAVVVAEHVAVAVVAAAAAVSEVEVEAPVLPRKTVVALVVFVVAGAAEAAVAVSVAAVAAAVAGDELDAHGAVALSSAALFAAAVAVAAVAAEHLDIVEHVVGTAVLVELASSVERSGLGIHDVGSYVRIRKPGSALRVLKVKLKLSCSQWMLTASRALRPISPVSNSHDGFVALLWNVWKINMF